MLWTLFSSQSPKRTTVLGKQSRPVLCPLLCLFSLGAPSLPLLRHFVRLIRSSLCTQFTYPPSPDPPAVGNPSVPLNVNKLLILYKIGTPFHMDRVITEYLVSLIPCPDRVFGYVTPRSARWGIVAAEEQLRPLLWFPHVHPHATLFVSLRERRCQPRVQGEVGNGRGGQGAGRPTALRLSRPISRPARAEPRR